MRRRCQLVGVVLAAAQLDEVRGGRLELGVVRLVEAEVVDPEGVADGAHLGGVVDGVDPVNVGSLVLHLRVSRLGERGVGVDAARGSANLVLVVPVLSRHGLALGVLAVVVGHLEGAADVVNSGLARAEGLIAGDAVVGDGHLAAHVAEALHGGANLGVGERRGGRSLAGHLGE